MKYTKKVIEQKLDAMKVIVDENLDAMQEELEAYFETNAETPIINVIKERLREIDKNIVDFCDKLDNTLTEMDKDCICVSTLIFEILAEDGWLTYEILTNKDVIQKLNEMKGN